MTKHVRVENADTGKDFKVVVQVWDKGVDGQPDTMANEVVLHNPCDMTGPEVYLTSNRYLVVKEG